MKILRTTGSVVVWSVALAFVSGLICYLCSGRSSAAFDEPVYPSSIVTSQPSINRNARQKKSFVEYEKGLLKRSPVLAAIRQAEPAEYKKFRNELRAWHDNGGPMREYSLLSRKYILSVLNKRLSRATPETAKKFIVYQLRHHQKLYNTSPDALFAILNGGVFTPEDLKPDEYKKLEAETDSVSRYLPPIITAQMSPKPLRQDNRVIESQIKAFVNTLTQQEAAVFQGKEKNRDAFCRAYLRLYQFIVKMPDDEAIQVMRAVDIIPKDNR